MASTARMTDSDKVTINLKSSLYRTALNALPDPLVVVAPGGEVVVCNDAWRHLVKEHDAAAETSLGISFAEAHHALCGKAATRALEAKVLAVLVRTLPAFSGVYRCDFPKRLRSYQVTTVPLANGHHACLVRYNNGHETGDQVLCQVAARLVALSRESDLLARLGGDEFLILLQDVTLQQSRTAAERYRRSLAQPFTLNGVRIRLRGSFGIAHYPDDGESIEDLVQYADQAMYQAKAAGGGVHHVP